MERMVGADVAELLRLGAAMHDAAEQLDAISGEVGRAFGGTAWEGPDGDYFRGQWKYRLSGLLHTTVLAARQAADQIRAQADQQETASGADGTGGGAALLGAAGSALAAGILLDVTHGLVDAGGVVNDGLKLLDRVGVHPLLHELVRDRALFGISESATGLAGAVRYLDKVGPLALLGDVLDGGELVHGLATDPLGPETLKSGIDTAFDVAALATSGTVVAPLAIEGVHLAYDLAYDFDPQLNEQIFHAAGAVANAAVDVVKSDVRFASDAASAVGNVVSGGVNAVRNLFHW